MTNTTGAGGTLPPDADEEFEDPEAAALLDELEQAADADVAAAGADQDDLVARDREVEVNPGLGIIVMRTGARMPQNADPVVITWQGFRSPPTSWETYQEHLAANGGDLRLLVEWLEQSGNAVPVTPGTPPAVTPSQPLLLGQHRQRPGWASLRTQTPADGPQPPPPNEPTAVPPEGSDPILQAIHQSEARLQGSIRDLGGEIARANTRIDETNEEVRELRGRVDGLVAGGSEELIRTAASDGTLAQSVTLAVQQGWAEFRTTFTGFQTSVSDQFTAVNQRLDRVESGPSGWAIVIGAIIGAALMLLFAHATSLDHSLTLTFGGKTAKSGLERQGIMQLCFAVAGALLGGVAGSFYHASAPRTTTQTTTETTATEQQRSGFVRAAVHGTREGVRAARQSRATPAAPETSPAPQDAPAAPVAAAAPAATPPAPTPPENLPEHSGETQVNTPVGATPAP